MGTGGPLRRTNSSSLSWTARRKACRRYVSSSPDLAEFNSVNPDLPTGGILRTGTVIAHG